MLCVYGMSFLCLTFLRSLLATQVCGRGSYITGQQSGKQHVVENRKTETLTFGFGTSPGVLTCLAGSLFVTRTCLLKRSYER
jgi:hypothetical protein